MQIFLHNLLCKIGIHYPVCTYQNYHYYSKNGLIKIHLVCKLCLKDLGWKEDAIINRP